MVAFLFDREVVGLLLGLNLLIRHEVVRISLLLSHLRVLVVLLYSRGTLFLVHHGFRFCLIPDSLLHFLAVERFLVIFVSLTNFINLWSLREFVLLEWRVELSMLVYFLIFTADLRNFFSEILTSDRFRRLVVMLLHGLSLS